MRDKTLLDDIKNSIGVGRSSKQRPHVLQLVVQSMKELEVVVNHFNRFLLLTKKRGDFELLCEILKIIERGEHLTSEGLRKIVAIRASMNLGLSDKLKIVFPDVVRVERPEVELPQTIDPELFSGFTSAEGCFYVHITESKTHSLGQRVILVFSIVQHVRDVNLMKRLKEFLNCGNLYKKRETFQLMVTKFEDIVTVIIPFFKKYPIRGVKALDFAD